MDPGKYGLQGILTATSCLRLVYQPYSPLLHMMQASTACAAISASDLGPRCGRHRKEDLWEINELNQDLSQGS